MCMNRSGAENQARMLAGGKPQQTPSFGSGGQGWNTGYREPRNWMGGAAYTPSAPQQDVWGTANDPRISQQPVSAEQQIRDRIADRPQGQQGFLTQYQQQQEPAQQTGVWGTENDPRLNTTPPAPQANVWGTENDPRIRANGGVTTPQTTQATPVQQETANQLRSGSPPLPTRRRSNGFPRSVQRNMWSRS